MLLSGDVRKDVKKQLLDELARLSKLADMGENVTKEVDQLEDKIKGLDDGLKNPFLSLIGYTTPSTFNQLVDYEQSVNGFFGRSLLVFEKETNPKMKKNFKPAPLPMPLEMTLSSLANDPHRIVTGKPLTDCS